MKLDYIMYSLNHVKNRKMRSWLTVLSILIGITAIYALVSFGQGLQIYMSELATEMGTDKLMIQPKGAMAAGFDLDFYISKEEADFISKVNGIDEVIGMYAKAIEVEHKKQKKYVFGMSLPTQGKEKDLVYDMFTVSMDQGRELKSGDKLKVTLGYNYQFANKIFSKAINIGDKISINGVSVDVVGFFESLGSAPDDSQVYLTEEGMLLIFPETEDKFQYVFARTAPGEEPSEVAERAEEKLRKFKGQKEGQEDFIIQTFEQAIEVFGTIITVINAVLLLIAMISVVVASVNIMNTMYTAVLERTKEIGVMKAIGAKNIDIMFIFLFEAGLLGLIGGALGILLGYGIAKMGGSIAASAGYGLLQPVFPLWLTIGCLLFAFFVGAFSGLMPARQASKLKPVDALRYE